MIKKSTFVWILIIAIVFTACVSSFAVFTLGGGLAKVVEYIATDGLGFAEDNTKLDEVAEIMNEYYYTDVDDSEMLNGALHGMVDAVGDDYTYYMTEEEYAEYVAESNNEYVGIGVLVDTATGPYLRVKEVYDDSPAQEAGIEVGDLIVNVEGTEVTIEDSDFVVDTIRGVAGTNVTFIVDRDGERIEMTVTRAKVNTPDLTYEMIGDGIGYIDLMQFDLNSVENFANAIEDLKEQGMEGLVLDLRGNPGGYLTSCVSIASYLIPDDAEVFHVTYKDGSDETFMSENNYIDMPIVILINENSASASEVVSGSVQANGTGTIIGTTSFGKGIMQDVKYLTDGSVVKLTVATWYLPNGDCIHGNGITPDIECELSDDAVDYYYENGELSYGVDNQLQEAVDEMRSQLVGK